MARKTAVEQQLDDLQAFADESYLQRTDVRRALEAQGAPLPPKKGGSSQQGALGGQGQARDSRGVPLYSLARSDASNPFTGDEEGPATTDDNGVTAVNAQDATVSEDGDDLDALTAETLRLQQATRDRRAAEALKANEPESDAALRQKTADQIQAALGRAQQVSNLTQRGVRERVFNAADRLGAVSTPGGIAALLLILIVLLLILVPVNGQPRLVWLWLVLTRKASLMSESDAAALSSTLKASPPEPIQPIGETPATPSAAGILAAQTATYPHSQSSGTPINVTSDLLNSANSGLARYINP